MHPIIVCIFASTNASATLGAERSDATSVESDSDDGDKPDKLVLLATTGVGNIIIN